MYGQIRQSDEVSDKVREYEADVKRMRDQYGPDAEIPNYPMPRAPLTPTGLKGDAKLTRTCSKITALGEQIGQAAQQLSEARMRWEDAQRMKKQAEAQFATLAEELHRLIQEHREGTSEGVPYPSCAAPSEDR